MRVLIACEFSGIVRDAFLAAGHDALSCDLLPTERPGPHYQGDVRDLLDEGWDLMVAHPPCTHLAVSGARHFARKRHLQQDALRFVRMLLDAPIDRIALENPVSIIGSRIRPPDQIIQPWQFGHEETKTTCLWLKNLPHLRPTQIMQVRNRNLTQSGQNRLAPSPTRWMERSRTYSGIADAMAHQWGQMTPVQMQLCAARNREKSMDISEISEIKQRLDDAGDMLARGNNNYELGNDSMGYVFGILAELLEVVKAQQAEIERLKVASNRD